MTNHPAADWSPTLSPDRSRVVFSSSRDDANFDLYLVGADGSGVTRLTSSPGFDFVRSQAWSPDGSRIAFWSTRDDPRGEIYVMNADGSGVVRLTHNDAWDTNPAWSPDGSSIAFCSTRGGDGFQTDIYRMSAIDGSGVVKVASDGCDPAWSPDGSRIAYTAGVSDEFSTQSIGVIRVDGSDPILLSDPVPIQGFNFSTFSPSWSPDGSEIAFSASGLPNATIWIMSFDGNGFGGGLKFLPGLSPSWR